MKQVQRRMARAALNSSTQDLGRMVGFESNNINLFETGRAARVSRVDKMRAAIEAAGVIFVAENGEGPSIRMRKDAPGAAGATIIAKGAEARGKPRRLSISPRRDHR